tara:strand:- start:2958 stop:4199 length:1242 start_codon:yes stop_codon:yes gene_type:complete
MYNYNIVKKLEPKKLILYGLFFWLILFVFSPFSLNQSPSLNWYIFIFLNVIFFLIGASVFHQRRKKYQIDRYKINKLFYLFFWIALLGVSLKLFDKFFIRDISFGTSVFENRDLSSLKSANIIGIIGSLLSPISFYTFFLFYKYKIKLTKIMKIIVLAMPFLQVIDSIAIGSRSALLVTVIFILLILLILNKIKFSFKKNIIYFSMFLSLLFFMQYIFIERTREFIDESDIKSFPMEESVFNFTLKTNDEFQNYVKENNNIISNLLFSYTLSAKYYLHGMFELNYLINNFKHEHLYGEFTFSLYKRIFYKAIGRKYNTHYNIMPRNGIFTTFLGPIFIDFAWFSPLFLFILGGYCKRVHNRLILNDDSSAMLYIYLASVILFFPVFNFISGVGGLYIFTSFLSINFITKLKLS